MFGQPISRLDINLSFLLWLLRCMETGFDADLLKIQFQILQHRRAFPRAALYMSLLRSWRSSWYCIIREWSWSRHSFMNFCTTVTSSQGLSCHSMKWNSAFQSCPTISWQAKISTDNAYAFNCREHTSFWMHACHKHALSFYADNNLT